MTKKELKTVYRIKGLAKEHPANKEFNKFMKRIQREELKLNTYDGCKLKLVALLQRNVIKSNNIKILEQFENLIRQQTAKEIFKDLESKFTNKITDTIMWKNLKKKWLE